MFSSEGIMEDIPPHLIVIPVSRQGLRTDEIGRVIVLMSLVLMPYLETGDELMMRLDLALLR